MFLRIKHFLSILLGAQLLSVASTDLSNKKRSIESYLIENELYNKKNAEEFVSSLSEEKILELSKSFEDEGISRAICTVATTRAR